MKMYEFLFVLGICLIASTIGIGARQAYAAARPVLIADVKCDGGTNCPDGSSSVQPCEFGGRACKTSEGCLCGATGNTAAPLCQCEK